MSIEHKSCVTGRHVLHLLEHFNFLATGIGQPEMWTGEASASEGTAKGVDSHQVHGGSLLL